MLMVPLLLVTLVIKEINVTKLLIVSLLLVTKVIKEMKIIKS